MSEVAETENPARYALFKALFLRSEGRSQVEAHRLIDAFAHELAEEQRHEHNEVGGGCELGVCHGDSLPDLIDPSAGLVRPDEEPT